MGGDVCSLPVPVFMFISFVLTTNTIKVGARDKIFRRLFKLYFPQLVWAGIYWLVHQIFMLASYKNMSDLGWQLLVGCSRNINPPMWYQSDLIFLTIIFIVFYKIFQDSIIYIIPIIITGSLFIQYSGINYKLFINCIYEIRYPAGRIIEMLPYACLGILFIECDLFEKIKSKRWTAQWILFIFCVIGIVCDRVCEPEGFGYQGIQRIAIALFLATNFYIYSFEKINIKIQNVIFILSRYSLGIYCMHFMIGQMMNACYVKLGLKTGMIGECILIYLICLISAMGIAKIPLKFCKDMVM